MGDFIGIKVKSRNGMVIRILKYLIASLGLGRQSKLFKSVEKVRTLASLVLRPGYSCTLCKYVEYTELV